MSTQEFEAQRPRLTALATRMLGSSAEAEDVVQEAWLRYERHTREAGETEIENLPGWLTTVTSRLCLDHLRSRAGRDDLADRVAQVPQPEPPTPEASTELADSVGAALVVVLETLTPDERVAFVLHDLFGLPFERIAGILDRSVPSTRQLASRARRRVRGGEPEAVGTGPDRRRRREIVEAFLAAAKGDDFATLLALLHPDAIVRADAAGREMGAFEATGADPIAQFFAGGAQAARLVTVDREPAVVWSHLGQVMVVFSFTIEADRITGIDLIADRAAIEAMQIGRIRDFDQD